MQPVDEPRPEATLKNAECATAAMRPTTTRPAGGPRRAAVCGQPIAHSLSPVLHQAAYAELGLDDWTYERFEIDDEAGLAWLVAQLDDTWRGLSLTMPLKRACLMVADEVSDLAAEVAVGNTLTRQADGGWRADNTDIGGMVDALRPHWAGYDTVAVLGAGATALSAVYALRELGAAQVKIYARDRDSAQLLADRAMSLGQTASAASDLQSWTQGEEQVIITTLPARAWADASGISATGLTIRRIAPQLVFDVVYDGWPTPLAQIASALGVTVVGGLDLLAHQAARQFEQFTGRFVPVNVMLTAGQQALASR